MRQIEAIWFCGFTGNVGVVRVEHEHGIKYYIGACEGIDEKADAQFIADNGMPFPASAGKALFVES